jgi:hypothetical protein
MLTGAGKDNDRRQLHGFETVRSTAIWCRLLPGHEKVLTITTIDAI